MRYGVLLAIVVGACSSNSVQPSATSSGGTSGAGSSGGASGGSSAGDNDAVTCGDLGSTGACTGTLAQWCDAGTIDSLDCSQFTDGACATTASLGAWCAVGVGDPCSRVSTTTRASYFYCGDAHGPAAGMACDVDTGCVSSSDTCTVGAAPTCQGTDLVVDCTAWGQAVIRECTGPALGGTGCSNGECVGLPVGAPCDYSSQCASGLVCNPTLQQCEAT